MLGGAFGLKLEGRLVCVLGGKRTKIGVGEDDTDMFPSSILLRVFFYFESLVYVIFLCLSRRLVMEVFPMFTSNGLELFPSSI